MNSNKAKQAIQEYLNKENKDTAILINGNWGAGKTFFINHLSEKDLLNKKNIYLSLKGISTTVEIGKQIAFKLAIQTPIFDKIINKTKINQILKIFGNIKQLPITDINGILSDYIYEFSDFNKYVFIFDDLERLSNNIQFSDVLYYIHSLFLENKKSNVLIVANKSELEVREKETLSKAFNKVISQEIKLEIDISDIFDDYINYRYKNHKKIFENYKHFFNKVFAYATTKNIRIYNNFFDAFIYLYLEMVKINIDKKYFSIILQEICGYLIDLYEIHIEEKTKEQKKLESMYPNNYIDQLQIDKIIFTSVKEYKENGFINSTLFKQEILQRKEYYVYKEKILTPYQYLMKPESISNKTLIDNIETLIHSKIYNIETLINIYSYIYFYNDIGMIAHNLFVKYKKAIFEQISKVIFDSKDKSYDLMYKYKMMFSNKEVDDIINNAINEKRKKETKDVVDKYKKGVIDEISNSKFPDKQDLLELFYHTDIIFKYDFKKYLNFIKNIIIDSKFSDQEIENLIKKIINSITEKNQSAQVYYFIKAIDENRSILKKIDFVKLLKQRVKKL